MPQNFAIVVFTLKLMISEYPNKSTKLWDTFAGKVVGKNFQKSLNLVTLLIPHVTKSQALGKLSDNESSIKKHWVDELLCARSWHVRHLVFKRWWHVHRWIVPNNCHLPRSSDSKSDFHNTYPSGLNGAKKPLGHSVLYGAGYLTWDAWLLLLGLL